MTARSWPVVLVAVAAFLGCGSGDPKPIVIKSDFSVDPGKFAFQKVTLDRAGTFTLTLTPQGGDVEAWFSPGEAQPLVVYDRNEPLPMAKRFEAGKEDSTAGSCDWGGHHLVVFNRGAAAVQVRCTLTVVENPTKP